MLGCASAPVTAIWAEGGGRGGMLGCASHDHLSKGRAEGGERGILRCASEPVAATEEIYA